MTNRRYYLLALALAVLVVASCGGRSLSGEYASKNREGMIQKVTFLSGNRAELDFTVIKVAGTYSVDGKAVKITLTSGQIYEFAIDAYGGSNFAVLRDSRTVA